MRFCQDFTPASLESSALCPYCHYSPKNEGIGSTTNVVLAGMPQQLEMMLEKWTELLLANLKVPEVKKHLELLSAEERQAVSEFQETHNLPHPIPLSLIEGLKKAMGGLEKLVIHSDELVQKLKTQGPCEPHELLHAFELYLAQLVNGRDEDKVRIIIEE